MESQIALAGNPNSGKTTLFNMLTGSHPYIGDSPGVTIEKREGIYKYNGYRVYLVDLPGTYSLSVYSTEELIARDYLVNNQPEVIINVVDASSLERNLYLSVQFMEIGAPICIALNMIDIAKSYGITIDSEKLSRLLGVPVIPIIARTGYGLQQLMETVITFAQEKQEWSSRFISYGEIIDKVIFEMETIIKRKRFMTKIYSARWIALKYLENDKQIIAKGDKENFIISNVLEKSVQNISIYLQDSSGSYPESIIATHRYNYIKSILKQGIIQYKNDSKKIYASDKIDKIVVNRFFGPIIMFAVIMGIYYFTSHYGNISMNWIEACLKWFSGIVSSHMPDSLIKSLIISGIISGIGSVLRFVPLMMFMFLGITVLEDSGYLARIAFISDRVFRIFGMHGNSVIPYIVSGGIAGGCAVPGIMSARKIKAHKERLATLLTIPFMNCGAKLPVFLFLIGTFSEQSQVALMLIFTLFSWIGAMLIAKLLTKTVIKGNPTPFTMELPFYRFPSLQGIIMHTWERTWQYIRKAGTVIVSISVVIWIMMNFPMLPQSEVLSLKTQQEALIGSCFPSVIQELKFANKDSQLSKSAQKIKYRLALLDQRKAEAALKHSMAGRIGISIEKVTKFSGFNWQINIALIGGFAAKELIVSTLAAVYSLERIAPQQSISFPKNFAKLSDWDLATTLSFITFTMFYAPCFVTVVCIAKEAGSWKWGVFSIVFNTLLAFFLSVLVFQGCSIIIL